MLYQFLIFATFAIVASNAATCVCIKVDSLNVRAKEWGPIIGVSHVGQCFPYKGKCGNWYKMSWKSGEGCVSNGATYTYLKACGGSVPAPAPVSGSTWCSQIPEIVYRAGWGARAARARTYLRLPVTTVFIHHTTGGACYSRSSCIAKVKGFQNYHMNTLGWSDIGYNFLVGSDGRAYEGRGFNIQGAHTKGCNSVSIGIAMIGNYHYDGGIQPSQTLMRAVRNIIDCGFLKGSIVSWGHNNILGHRDVCSTACPGSYGYSMIKSFFGPSYGRNLRPCSCY